MIMKKILLICLTLPLLFSSCRKDERITPSPEVTAENALEHYLNNDDQTYSWVLRESYDLAGVKVYVLLLVSQQWREYSWVHQLSVLVPPEVDHDGALLFINGNSVQNGQPKWESPTSDLIIIASLIAQKNKAVTSILWQTPNQPLYNGLSEDALISFTLHNFTSDKDYTWPLLFPMVKGAQRAMDAVKHYISEIPGENFIHYLANADLDIGLHLTLTSEWKTYRWGPVSDLGEVPGLLDDEGKLWRSVREVVMNATPEEVEKEIRAQIERALALGLQPGHIDTHMGTLYGHHAFTAAYTKVAQEYGIPAMVIDMSKEEVVQGFRDAGYPINEEMVAAVNNYKLPKLDFFASAPDGKSYEDKRANFMALVKSLPVGLTEIIFHPSVHSENLKTITNSWKQRVWEAQLFADPEMQGFFEKEGIIFTNWKEIMERFEERK